MITFLLILSFYSAILSSFLFGKWVRIVIKRRQVRKEIELEMASPDQKAFLEAHPPTNTILSQVKEEEEEGEVIRGFEAEMDQAESEEIEESVEEREYREEEMIRLKRGSRR